MGDNFVFENCDADRDSDNVDDDDDAAHVNACVHEMCVRACMRACVHEHGTARIYDDALDEAAPVRRQLTTLTTTTNATRHGDGDHDDCGAVPRRPNHDDHTHEQACVHARVRA